MSRINSAQQPLFAIAVPIWQGIRESVGSHLPRAELLRRTVPVLIAIFASLAAIGLVSQTLQSRQSAFALAEERLALMADLTAVRLKDESLKPDSNWQSALAASLPKGATQDERTALLANDDGELRFALLSDWTDSPQEHAPDDAQQALKVLPIVMDAIVGLHVLACGLCEFLRVVLLRVCCIANRGGQNYRDYDNS